MLGVVCGNGSGNNNWDNNGNNINTTINSINSNTIGRSNVYNNNNNNNNNPFIYDLTRNNTINNNLIPIITKPHLYLSQQQQSNNFF